MNIRILIISFLFPFLAFAQKNDTPQQVHHFPAVSQVDLRYFDKENLDNYRKMEAFNYTKAKYEKSEIAKLWDRFVRSFFSLFNKTVNNKWLNRIIAVIVLFFLLRYLVKMNTNNIVSRSDKKTKRYIEELDIRMDESMIYDRLNKAKDNENWREAVRYSYLIILKKLNEKDKIRWKEWKLSKDYLNEISDKNLTSDFGKLTTMFNFTWYGQRKLIESQYKEFDKDFKDFMSKPEIS